jgi:hypothetical protein
MTDLRKAADPYIRPGTVVPVDIETTKILVDLLRQALAQPPCQTGSQCIGGKCPECEWVGLDEDRVAHLADKYAPPIDPAFKKDDDYWRFYQEIEVELKEKNSD